MISHMFRIFLCCLFLFVPIGASAQTVAASDAELRQGQKMYLDGDLAGALSHYRQVALSRPNDPNVLFLIAQALGDQGLLPEAEVTYLKAIPLYQQLQTRPGSGVTYQPNIAMTLNNLAAIYSREKRFDEASKAIEQALTVCLVQSRRLQRCLLREALFLKGNKRLRKPRKRIVPLYPVLLRIPMLC
jgi:tetratricopeptide (TPR) repeat protein